VVVDVEVADVVVVRADDVSGNGGSGMLVDPVLGGVGGGGGLRDDDVASMYADGELAGLGGGGSVGANEVVVNAGVADAVVVGAGGTDVADGPGRLLSRVSAARVVEPVFAPTWDSGVRRHPAGCVSGTGADSMSADMSLGNAVVGSRAGDNSA